MYARQNANVLSALVKRLSRTEECPVDILRGKCGARVRDFDVEHIELLIAQVAGRAEILQKLRPKVLQKFVP